MPKRQAVPANFEFIGVDGEGIFTEAGHIYTLLCASGERMSPRALGDCRSPLGTSECLDFLLNLPARSIIVGFSLGYDYTMLLRDLPNDRLWHLYHPETRRTDQSDLHGIFWSIGEKGSAQERVYSLNMVGKGELRIKRRIGPKIFRIKDGKELDISRYVRRTVWDVWSFFVTSFVKALGLWKIGEEEVRTEIARMKGERSNLANESKETIVSYCQNECRLLAGMMRSLYQEHQKFGAELKRFSGAGSSGAAFLTNLKAKSFMPKPDEMPDFIHVKGRKTPYPHDPCEQAFFGGRFENAVIGPILIPSWNLDISSAYPAAIVKLPCLVHGKWSFTKDVDRAKRASLALIHYRWSSRPLLQSWGPLPFRTKNGDITFPLGSGGGWIWAPEFWPAQRLSPELEMIEAWIYEAGCHCQPFARVQDYYQERLKWGKEGKGLVIKLGLNSMYGKMAQSVGRPPFRNLIWAGNVTSACRGQLLEMILRHRCLNSVLAVATDGIISTERIEGPDVNAPSKPLGGWERKDIERGVFFLQPGVYLPPTGDAILEEIKSRGVARSAVAREQLKILEGWKTRSARVTLNGIRRFWGVKSCLRMHRDGSFVRDSKYGQWESDGERDLRFDAKPKRAAIDGQTLIPWQYPLDGPESLPYNRNTELSDTARAAQALKEVLLEQPDCELDEYEEDAN